jgi:NADPH-dependent glutamate synthase beta subunit-like oxidoreductase
VTVGTDISIGYLRRSFDAVLLTCGARVPRDLQVPGRELTGIHFAMDFLGQQNRINGGEPVPDAARIVAAGKRVVVLGGGDTGADCVGTCHRQKAQAVMQFEILPKPPPTRDSTTPWPQWPYQLRSSSSHDEGGERRWAVQTKAFSGRDGRVCGLRAVEVEWGKDEAGRMQCRELAGTQYDTPADLVLLALGFTKDGNARILREFGLATDAQGNAVVDRLGMSDVQGIFVAGDLAAGASLVVRAIAEGRRVADGMHHYLMHVSPDKDGR